MSEQIQQTVEEDYASRRTRILLESVEAKGTKTEEEMESLQGQALVEAGVAKQNVVRVSHWGVKKAIDDGDVIPGWHLSDYIRGSFQGYPDDPPLPRCTCGFHKGRSEAAYLSHQAEFAGIKGHKREVVRRFELVNVWGVQGAKKSNFVGQMLGKVHGGFNPGLSLEEWRKVWDWCQTVTLTNADDLIRVGRKLETKDQRFDVLYFDDINAIIPKQLGKTDIKKYEKLHTILGMVRREVATIITSEPNIEVVSGIFNRMMTFEVFVTRSNRYVAERMCHGPHPYFWAKDKVRKIIVEEAPFDFLDLPDYWWDGYHERTKSEGHKKWLELLDVLEAPEVDTQKLQNSAVSKAFTISDVREAAAKVGIKASGEKLAELNRELKDRAANRLNVPTGETPENSSEN